MLSMLCLVRLKYLKNLWNSLDNQLARYRAMEKDAKTLAQDHVLTVELIEAAHSNELR